MDRIFKLEQIFYDFYREAMLRLKIALFVLIDILLLSLSSLVILSLSQRSSSLHSSLPHLRRGGFRKNLDTLQGVTPPHLNLPLLRYESPPAPPAITLHRFKSDTLILVSYKRMEWGEAVSES